MISKILAGCAAAALIAAIANPGFAAESAKAPSIEGTYKLVSRKLADAKVLSGQEVVGLFTYTKTHRNFNLAWKDSAGKHWSYSVVSTYKLTATEYTETRLVSILTDEISGKGTTYDLAGSTRKVPVKVSGGRIEIQLPFDPVTAVFDAAGLTGTNNEGLFVDRWEKVK